MVCTFTLLHVISVVYGIHGVSGSSKTGTAQHEYSYHEVTIPWLRHSGHRQRRSFSSINGNHADGMSVEINAFNKNMVLDLKLNRNIFSKSYIEKHYREDGSPVIQRPHLEKSYHCYYHGSVRGVPDSLVAVSTCEGLRGLIHGDDQFYIEPSNSTNHEHLIYKTEHRLDLNHSIDGSSYPLQLSTLLDNSHRKAHQRVRRDVKGPWNENADTRYVEMYFVNDYRQFRDLDSDVNKTARRTVELANIANALFNQLNIYLALVGVETWSAGDRIAVKSDADETLENFIKYRMDYINPVYRNDNAQFITGYVFRDGVVGKAKKFVICTHEYSAAVNMDHQRSVQVVATTVTHELGHSFGMEHDSPSCECPDSRCIMAATSGGRQPTKWSSCSKKYLADAFKLGMDYCLYDKPESIVYGPSCGNGYLEAGEECDCGLPEDCTNKCCNATSCTLTVNATCATGQCCDKETCQFKAEASVCRDSHGECDLPEYCNGESEFCPGDYYKQDGTVCSEAGLQSHCYKGQCNTPTERCKLLWGPSGKMSSRICFEENMRGTLNGNCGYNWLNDTFYKCNEEDVMCGMLHCIHTNEKLMFWRDSLVKGLPRLFPLNPNGGSFVCRAAILDVGLNMVDPGMVPDGSSCGDNKMCVNHRCRSVKSLNIPTCLKNCSDHGVCNNVGSCHCDIGFAPPLCNSEGAGGSLQSGPATVFKGLDSVTVAMLVLFLCVLPLLGLTLFCSWYHREKIKKYWISRTLGRKYQQAPRSVKTETRSNPPRPAAPKPAVGSPIRPQRPAPSAPPARGESFRNKEISQPMLTSTTNETSDTKLAQVIPYAVLKKAPPLPANPPPANRRVAPPRPLSMAAAPLSQIKSQQIPGAQGNPVRKSSSFSSADHVKDNIAAPPIPPGKPCYANVGIAKLKDGKQSPVINCSKTDNSTPGSIKKVVSPAAKGPPVRPSPPAKRFQSKQPSLDPIPQGDTGHYELSTCNCTSLLDDIYAEIGESSGGNVYDDIESAKGVGSQQKTQQQKQQPKNLPNGNTQSETSYDNIGEPQVKSSVAALAAKFSSAQPSMSKSQSFAGPKPQKPFKPRNLNRDSIC